MKAPDVEFDLLFHCHNKNNLRVPSDQVCALRPW